MTDIDKAVATQLANIEQRSGKSLAELKALLSASGLTKHGELRDLLKRELGMGHGDANSMVHHALGSSEATEAAGKSGDEVLDAIEVGLNMKGVPGTARLVEQAPGGMCNYKVKVDSVEQVDAELLGWIRQAFDSAA